MLTSRQMCDLMDLHTQEEMTGNVAAVMATCGPAVTWGARGSIHFHEGFDAVQAHYEHVLPPPGNPRAVDFAGWADEERQSAFGYWRIVLDDEPSYLISALFTFRDDLIVGEEGFHIDGARGCGRTNPCPE
jgi:hypothetical protein